MTTDKVSICGGDARSRYHFCSNLFKYRGVLAAVSRAAVDETEESINRCRRESFDGHARIDDGL